MRTSAPKARDSRILAAGVSAGIAITQPSPAFAAYAAAAPPGVSRRGDSQGRRSKSFGHRNRCREPAGLERACRVESLVLNVKTTESHAFAKPLSMNERRHAFSEANRWPVGEDFFVPPHRVGARLKGVQCQRLFCDRQVIAGKQG